MRLQSTRHQSPEVGFEEAIFRGLPPDNGLYLPVEIPTLSPSFWQYCDQLNFQEIATAMACGILQGSIPEKELRALIFKAMDFSAPAVKLHKDLYCLELFHGPSMAFKDFGARFMATTMSYFLEQSGEKLNILVATSGDTGGAVAQGFFGVPGISVTILYPKGKVSQVQEQQLTTLGGNVKAIEVNGTFDDCQALVKQAFLDEELRSKYRLASANSINIARLIPQSFYYAYAYAQLKHLWKDLVISVPSGNFGNLTAGVMAMRMGMPVSYFVAATNVNKVVPNYLESGEFEPISPSIPTLSNAMDVGNPSNFPRLLALFDGDVDKMRAKIKGFSFTDEETKVGVRELYESYHYLACPHTSVAYLGLKKAMEKDAGEHVGVFLSTAHYGKFLPEMESILGFSPELPEALQISGKKDATEMENTYTKFRAYLTQHLI